MAKQKTAVQQIVAATGLKGSLRQIQHLVEGHMTLFFGNEELRIPANPYTAVPYIKGPPGIGKTDMIRALAKKFKVGFKDLPLIIWDTVDMRGVPYVRHEGGVGTTHWALPSDLPREGRGILFLDEFTQAFQSLQNCSSRLILARELGEYKVPRGWMVVLASNREGDRAATHKMASFLNNRVAHYEIDPTLEDWRAWAIENTINDRIVSFLSFRPHLLHEFDPDRPAFPSPRSWAFFSNLLAIARDVNDVAGYCVATVGPGAADEFVPFWEETAKLPSFEEILAAPSKAQLPTEPAPLYAVAVMLGQRVQDGQQPAIWRYVERLPEEYAYLALYVVMVRPDHNKIGGHDTITTYIAKHKEFMTKSA